MHLKSLILTSISNNLSNLICDKKIMPFSLTQQQKTTLSKYIDDQSIVDVFGALT